MEDENRSEFSKFSQKMDLESFPTKSVGFVTWDAPIMRVSFMFTITDPY